MTYCDNIFFSQTLALPDSNHQDLSDNIPTLAEFLPSRLLVIFKSLVVNYQRLSGYGVQKSLDRR